MHQFIQFVKQLGVLRLMLIALGIIATAFAGDADSVEIHHGWQIIPTVVVPASAPIVFFVMLFDLMMCRIRMSDAQGAERLRFRNISWLYLAVLSIMLIAWMPFILSMGRGFV